jgi:regulator of sigma E protease
MTIMTIFYLILAALALGVLVFVHELGHYFVAKKMGMTVETFSIGFGRPLLKWRWNQVNWQLGSLPFGGYVKIAGMEFGKKDKFTYNDPYEIPNGFFSKSPWKRIAVALAGPFANFILAFLIFTAIWAMGGREKPFAEFTQIVGWVDPHSSAYAAGIRPGDTILFYNGKPFTGSKDLLYAAMLGGKKVELKGYHNDYATGEHTPFTYTVDTYPAPNSLDGILTTGITSGARYLIYDRYPNGEDNHLPEGSPMQSSGIAYQDRLVWLDGEYLYSMDQMNHILNSAKTFLTLKRGDEIFLSRQPRIPSNQLLLPSYVRNELMDWQYEMGLKGRSQDLYMIPYIVNSEGYVEAPLDFIDRADKEKAFPSTIPTNPLEQSLQAGDRIIAVDGVPLNKGYQILDHLQKHRVSLIVEKQVSVDTKVSWLEEDKMFQQDVDYSQIAALSRRLGTPNADLSLGRFTLLNPIEPKSLVEFNTSEATRHKIQAQLRAEFEKQKKAIDQIRDQEKKVQALNLLEKSQHKLMLGIALQDRSVEYNPGPLSLFRSVFSETWQTLKALVTGYLNPKWISGPVGIVQVIHHGWQVGIAEALFWIGAISVNLGFLNLLPIPVLDGGYICLSLWELITRRRLKPRTMERLIIPFVVLMIGLLIFLTFQDITRLF